MLNNPDPLKWLLVGEGDIARKRVAPALAGAPGSALTAICDRRLDAAQSLAGTLGVEQVYADFGEALARSDVEAVYLATPVSLHVDQLIQVLQAGKHVLVEKPLGLSAAACQPALDAAAASGLTAACAYYRRLYPVYEHARRLLASGSLGQPLLVNLCYHSWFDPQPDDPKYWRVQRARSGGGPLSDMGSHMFDVLIGLLGLPRWVDARCDNRLRSWDVEDTAAIMLELPGGARALASFSWCSHSWRHEFEIVGSEGRLTWAPFDAGLVNLTLGRQVETISLPPAANVHLPLVADFIEAVRQSRPPVCPLAEAARTNRLLDAVYQSSAQRTEIALEP